MKYIILVCFFYMPYAFMVGQERAGFGNFAIDKKDIVNFLGNLENNFQAEFLSNETKLTDLKNQLIMLSQKKDAQSIGDEEYKNTCSQIQRAINRIEKNGDEFNKLNNELLHGIVSTTTGLVKGFTDLVVNAEIEEQQRKTKIAVAAATQAVANEGNVIKAEKEAEAAMQRLRFFSDKQNLKNYAMGFGLTSLGIFGSYYVCKSGYHYVLKKLESRPLLALETSYTGWMDEQTKKIYSFFGYAEQKPSLVEDIIFSSTLSKYIQTITQGTLLKQEKGLPHDAVLLYGPPGTGKTWFAKLLAYNSGMDYIITSADRFAQFAEGQDVAELHHLFDWASNIKKGVILFIDEIDALGVHRDRLDQRWIRLLNAFLSRTGTLLPNIKIIGATNRINALDVAFANRFSEKISIPLPGIDEREAMINLYIKKYIIAYKNIKNNLEVMTMDQTITATMIRNLAERMDGFSGRTIMQFVDAVRTESLLYHNAVVTPEVIESVLLRFIEQKNNA